MSCGLPLAEIGALVGDPGRANMLTALMDGRALTASELAWTAGVTPATASEHLAKLLEGGLLSVRKQGRHRYYALVSSEVAGMLERMMVVAAGRLEAEPVRRAVPRIDPALREARTCYDHLAGRVAVALADALAAENLIDLSAEAGAVTPKGRSRLAAFGLDVESLMGTRRLFCRPCLDWSERRPHLAGALGAALCRTCQDRGWIRRRQDSRAVEITPDGRTGFAEWFGVDA